MNRNDMYALGARVPELLGNYRFEIQLLPEGASIAMVKQEAQDLIKGEEASIAPPAPKTEDSPPREAVEEIPRKKEPKKKEVFKLTEAGLCSLFDMDAASTLTVPEKPTDIGGTEEGRQWSVEEQGVFLYYKEIECENDMSVIKLHIPLRKTTQVRSHNQKYDGVRDDSIALMNVFAQGAREKFAKEMTKFLNRVLDFLTLSTDITDGYVANPLVAALRGHSVQMKKEYVTRIVKSKGFDLHALFLRMLKSMQSPFFPEKRKAQKYFQRLQTYETASDVCNTMLFDLMLGVPTDTNEFKVPLPAEKEGAVPTADLLFKAVILWTRLARTRAMFPGCYRLIIIQKELGLRRADAYKCLRALLTSYASPL